jgi:flagellar hook-associated protein 3 FlgL
MRITEGTFTSGYLSTVNKTRERIVRLQSQLATGKLIQTASEDPAAADTILRLTESKKLREQYKNNAVEGQGIAETTSTTLGQISDVLLNIKDVVIRAGGSASTDDLKTYGESVNQLLTEMVDLANTKFNGKYILGGTQTQVPPYTIAADKSAVTKNPKGIDGVIKFQVGDDHSNQVNVSGEQALNGTQIFELIIQVRDSLNNGTFSSAAFVGGIEQATSHVLDSSSTAASYGENFMLVGDNLEVQENKLSEYISLYQDTDVAEAILQLKNQEVMLDAALNTGGRIIPKSLMDYMK